MTFEITISGYSSVTTNSMKLAEFAKHGDEPILPHLLVVKMPIHMVF